MCLCVPVHVGLFVCVCVCVCAMLLHIILFVFRDGSELLPRHSSRELLTGGWGGGGRGNGERRGSSGEGRVHFV